MKCVFLRYDGTLLCEKHMDTAPVRGDFVSNLPGHGQQEWFVERRRIQLRPEEVVELWVTLAT